ncbi:MAG: class I SAM-dependent methyltransferase [Deltaproteobacteria bacterium]|nr:class I SAM-dependent methyltransferase [Deltaproteobacteria bacterium]
MRPSLFWDFDDTLQKILLKIARTIATPEEIWQSRAERSRNGFSSAFVERKKWELDELSLRKTKPWFETTPREEFVFARIPHRSRLLYVGCDSGIECFPLAERGHQVTAIHTDPEMVEVANDWARHFRFPFKAICADLPEFTSARESFDSFIIDFYGSHPSMEQVITAQSNLARVITDDGLGFVVAKRKKFASYWFLMNTCYPSAMTRWLMKQAPLDFYYSKFDSAEERLLYGAYNRSYTSETLASELGLSFDVLECQFEKYDPRYVMAVVRRKDQPDITTHHRRTPVVDENNGLSKPYVWLTSNVQSICDILKSHEQQLSQYFDNRHFFPCKNPLQVVDTNMSEFIDLLIEVFETIPAQLR